MSSGRGGASTAATIATADALTRFTRDVFQRAGMSEVHAATVADVLVWASLRGVDSHGVARIPMYVRLIDDGDLNLAPTIAVQTETVASVLFDADRAAGPIAMTTATRAAVRKAGDAGIGMALVRATTHTAALGYYTLMAAQDGSRLDGEDTLSPAPGVVEVLMPGERGGRAYGERAARGIPIPPAIVQELRVVADRFGVPMFPSAP